MYVFMLIPVAMTGRYPTGQGNEHYGMAAVTVNGKLFIPTCRRCGTAVRQRPTCLTSTALKIL